MSAITRESLRDLADFASTATPVTTCYLNVDGRRFARAEDCELELARVVREARARGDAPVVPADLQRIEEHLQGGIDRSRVRGLAMFSCAAEDLWQVVELPVPVRSRLTVQPAPALAQLELVSQEAERVGVLLVDRQRARLWIFELGEVLDRLDLLDELPRDVDSVGHRDHTQPANHIEELVARHLRHAAREAFGFFEPRGVRHLVLAAPDALVSAMEQNLHPYLRERLRERWGLRVETGADELGRAVREAEHRFELQREEVLVGQLRAGVHRGDRGTAGLAATLGALVDRRAEHLLVSDGYAEPGWRCGSCAMLAAVGRSCPRCGAEMTRVADVVEEAVDEALQGGCRVDVCTASADLDVLGRIGALLRY